MKRGATQDGIGVDRVECHYYILMSLLAVISLALNCRHRVSEEAAVN